MFRVRCYNRTTEIEHLGAKRIGPFRAPDDGFLSTPRYWYLCSDCTRASELDPSIAEPKKSASLRTRAANTGANGWASLAAAGFLGFCFLILAPISALTPTFQAKTFGRTITAPTS